MSKVVNLIEKYLMKNGGDRLDEKKLQILGTQLTYLIHQPDSRPYPKEGYDQKDQQRSDIITIFTGDNHKVDGDVSYEIKYLAEASRTVYIQEIKITNKKATKGTKIFYDVIEIYPDGKKQGKREVFFKAKSMNKEVFMAYNDISDSHYPVAEIGNTPLGKR